MLHDGRAIEYVLSTPSSALVTVPGAAPDVLVRPLYAYHDPCCAPFMLFPEALKWAI